MQHNAFKKGHIAGLGNSTKPAKLLINFGQPMSLSNIGNFAIKIDWTAVRKA